MDREYEKQIYLSDAERLDVIKINGRTSNLALRTCVTVNTADNSTEVSYKVNPWNDHEVFKHINKTFNSYRNACDYHKAIVEKYSTLNT